MKGGIGSRYPSPYRPIASEQSTVISKQSKRADAPTNRRAEEPAKRKLTWKERRELEELEVEIGRLEGEKGELEEALNSVGGDYVRLGEISAELETITAQLDKMELRWLDLSELAD